MNFYAWSALFDAIACTACAVFVFSQGPRNKKYIDYALFIQNLGLWGVFYVFWQLSTNAKEALFFVRALSFFSILVPILFYRHALSLTEEKGRFFYIFLKVFYVLTGVLLLSNFTPLFVAGVRRVGPFPFWPYPGPFFEIDTINDAMPIGLALYLFWKFKKKASPAIQNYFAGVLVSFVIGYTALFTNLFLWYEIPIYPYGTSGLGIASILLTYIFFKVGIFDLKVFLRDGLVYLFTAGGGGRRFWRDGVYFREE